jgi:hypothetical protein
MLRPRRRFWAELASATVSGVLFAVTLAWHDWIELVTGRDPDQHNGSLEWVVVTAAFVVAVGLAVAARAEWRRRAAAPSAAGARC